MRTDTHKTGGLHIPLVCQVFLDELRTVSACLAAALVPRQQQSERCRFEGCTSSAGSYLCASFFTKPSM